MVPAQRLVSLCNVYSNEVSIESSRFDLDNRLTQDLEKPTPQEREVFCIENMNKSKANRFFLAIYSCLIDDTVPQGGF
jgi:hypothetical protein